MMNTKTIYFAQHGLALSKTQDPERPLSADGITQTTAVARHLDEILFSPSSIFHSGKQRALQTAEIFSATLSAVPVPVKQHSHLSPNDDIQQLIPQLQNNALYIGHLPQLDKLCSYLLCGNESTGLLQFQNSGVIALTLETDQCQLNWYLTPDIINRQ